MSKFYERIMTGMVVMIVFIMTYIAYMMFWPFETVSSQTNPFTVIEKTIQAGEILHYQTVFCRSTDEPVMVERIFRNAVDPKFSYATTVIPSVARAGPCELVHVRIEIPTKMPVGRYYVEIRTVTTLNPFRQIHKDFKTEEFDVIQ